MSTYKQYTIKNTVYFISIYPESIPNEKQRMVIEERYLKGFEKYDSECSFNLDMPTSSYSNYKAAGLIAVAWALGCEEY